MHSPEAKRRVHGETRADSRGDIEPEEGGSFRIGRLLLDIRDSAAAGEPDHAAGHSIWQWARGGSELSALDELVWRGPPNHRTGDFGRRPNIPSDWSHAEAV